MSSSYPHLFSPLTIGGIEVRNRTALPATLTNYAQASRITLRWQNFLIERARGGCGLVVSEIIAVDPQAMSHQAIVAGYVAENEPGLRATADGVHAAGSHIVGQLWHPGRQQLWQPSRSPMGVSDQPDAYSWTVPHVMSDTQLERLMDAYADTAIRLANCGFDGIELHGAHGYLITQLLSPWSNTRSGRFGGDRDARLAFCIGTAERIRARCPHGFVIGLKMPANEGIDGGIDAVEAALITSALAATGHFDYFAYGQGNFSTSLEDHVPDMHYQPGHFIDLHKKMRAAANGIPVMALGRIGNPDLAERIVAEGYGDLVGMSRAQVADAAWANKAAAGNATQIRPSVYNNFCWGEVHAGKPLEEFHNPQLGLAGEHDFMPPTSTSPKKIAVVGAGPAGLECAWTAAARGHQVALFGTHVKAGGKLRLEAALPGHAEMHRIIEHQLLQARTYGVEFHLGATVSAENLAEYDTVVLATGSQCRAPDIESDGSTPAISVHALAERLESHNLSKGKRAILLDHDHTAMTYGVADVLAEHFQELVLVTPRTHLAQAVNYCSALGVHRRLHTAGVNIITAALPVRVALHGVRIKNVFSAALTTIDDVDLLVYATPRQVNDQLHEALTTGGAVVHAIGDCVAPRNLMMAIHEGHAVAMQL